LDYYNEFDPYAADWLENLIAFDVIPDGSKATVSLNAVAQLAGWATPRATEFIAAYSECV